MSNDTRNDNGIVEFPWRILGKSVLGASHKRSGLPNQDAILWKQNPKKGVPLILAIADGHGSEKYFRSELGAQFAVQAAEQEMQSFLRTVANHAISTIEDLAEQLPRNIVGRWNSLVEDHWQENPFVGKEWQWLTKRENAKARREISDNYTIPYGATLLTVVVTETFILYLQLGDGDILTISTAGRPDVPIPEDKRNLANETTSLCTPDAARNFRTHFQKLARRRPALIMVSTDGYSNCFRDKAGFFKVGTDIWEMIRNEKDGLQKVEGSLEGWLTEATKTGSGDDITLGILCRMDALMELVDDEEEKKPAIANIEPVKGGTDGQQPVSFSTGSRSQPAGANSSKSNVPSPSSSSSPNASTPTANTPVEGDRTTSPSGPTHPQGQTLPQTQNMAQEKHMSSSSAAPTRQMITVSPEQGKGDTRSINEAIDTAKPHAQILVQPGVYEEQITINKPVDIVGVGDRSRIVIESQVPCLQIEHDVVVLSNLTIRGKTSLGTKDNPIPAIRILNAQPTIRECDITSESPICVGILGYGANPELLNCRIHGSGGRGILLQDDAQGLIENSRITDNASTGVAIIRKANARVKGCFILRNEKYGVYVDKGGQATVENCTLTGNKRGSWYISEGCHVDRHGNIEQ